jgi:hypothetical protein
VVRAVCERVTSSVRNQTVIEICNGIGIWAVINGELVKGDGGQEIAWDSGGEGDRVRAVLVVAGTRSIEGRTSDEDDEGISSLGLFLSKGIDCLDVEGDGRILHAIGNGVVDHVRETGNCGESRDAAVR